MTLPTIQPSFSAGEISPFLYGRVDLAKYHVGARIMLNWFVHPHGGASNDMGTRFVGEVQKSEVRHRLIPFRFRSSPSGQNYALVFGDTTMQVVMLGSGIPGFVESSPGVIFTLTTPYAWSDLPRLKFVQSLDTMTLTHPNHAPRKLGRTGHASWQLSEIIFAPVTPAPTGVAASSGSGTNIVVTAISDANGEESLPSADSGSGGAFAWNAVQGCTNYNVYKLKGSIYGFVAQVQTAGWTDANIAPDIGNTPPQQRNPFGAGKITAVTVQAAGTGYSSPTVKAVDQAGSGATFTAHVSGGMITSVDIDTQGDNYSRNATLIATDGSGSGAALQLNFVQYDDGAGSGVPYYSIDSVTVLSGGSGYSADAYAIVIQPGGSNNGAALALTVAAGAVTGATVTNAGFGFNPDFPFPYAQIYDGTGTGAVLVPTITADPNTFPQCSGFYQQRQFYGATLALPQDWWATVAGAFNNMSVRTPTRDDDAIHKTLVSRLENSIRHFVEAGTSLLVFTAGAEWRLWPGPNASAFTPGSSMALQQSTYGCSDVPPIVSGPNVLFVQERGSRVRSLKFDVLQDQFQASDMSIMSQHLLYDATAQYQIVDWCFQEEPFRIVWAVRSDGILLGFTWMDEHQVFAWHRHVTDGVVESVCSIPEQNASGSLLDAVYLIVRRTIGGVTRRYVERLAEREFASIADAWFVHCGLQYSGPPVTTLSGLDHLEGKSVAILGDGSVVPSQVVTNGAVTLDGPCSKVTVGLPYTCDLVTLDLDPQLPGGTTQGKMKRIAQVTVRVKDARGVRIGIEQEVPLGASAGTPKLVEVKQRSSETMGSPMQPYSGDWSVTIPSEWNKGGRLYIRQDYPLPVTILAVVPSVVNGD